MQSFFIFFESQFPSAVVLSPKTIYNFYFLYTLSQTRSLDQFSSFLVEEFAMNIKKTYLRVFKTLLYQQLTKYKSRGRVTPDFALSDGGMSPEELHAQMQKTFRSDMNRLNTRWIDLAQWVIELEHAETTKQIFYVVDRINNTTHNTQEIILSKFENSFDLMRAFDQCHNMNSLSDFRHYINKEYAQLL
jgi:hypothetical protein